MKIAFLGTNGWYDTVCGNTVCALVETSREYLVLDAGNGIHKLGDYIKTKKPVYLFLSHYHIDHISGLHTLAKMVLPQGLSVFGPRGLTKMFDTLIAAPYSVSWRKLRTRVKLYELPAMSGLPLEFVYLPLKHSTLCYGYRFCRDGKTVAYATDTGSCPNLIKLGRGADLFITECAFGEGETSRAWPHLNPQTAAHAAIAAGARKLVLTHFDASRYDTLAKRQVAGQLVKKIFPPVTVARDDMTITLKP